MTVEIVGALIIWAAALAIAWFQLMGRQFVITAAVAFLAYQAPNVLGVAVESVRSPIFREDWPLLVSFAFFAFVLGGVLANLGYKFKPAEEIPHWRDLPLLTEPRSSGPRWPFVWFMVSISLVVGIIFYRSIGYNTLLSQIEVLVSGSSVDAGEFSSKRGAVLSEGYRAAGFAVQFVSIILPTLIAYIWVEGKLTKSSGLKFLATGLLLVDIYFVTVQGGRTYILAVVLLLILLVAHPTSPLPAQFRIRRSISLGLLIAFVASFSLVTALQGRTSNADSDEGAAATALVGIWDRVGGDYSRTQMVALAALEPEVPAHGGQWWSQLKIALPGAPEGGEPFDVRVYRIIYGTDNGNNPLDPWGSYYYNFGVIGLITIPFVLGFFAQAISITGLFRGRRDVATVVIMSALGYRFMFVIDPYSLLLAGPFTLWLLNRLMRVFSYGASGKDDKIPLSPS